jgi:hypothetical protein
MSFNEECGGGGGGWTGFRKWNCREAECGVLCLGKVSDISRKIKIDNELKKAI